MYKLANLETRLQIIKTVSEEMHDRFIYKGVFISINTALQNNSYPLKHELSSDPVYVHK